MRLAELRGPRDFVVVDADLPVPGRDELLVRVGACGVCASELSSWTGSRPVEYPVRIGHEVTGTVVEVGAEVTDFVVGERVAVWATGAGYAEYVSARAEHCRPVPAAMATELALLEPIACASNAVEAADVRLGDRVIVVGAGFMGLLVTRLLALRGVTQLIVADSRPDTLKLARTLGATETVDVSREPLEDAVERLTGGRGMDMTFEVTGAQSALDVIGDLTRMSGTLVLVGFHLGEPRRIPLAQWNWLAFRLVNAHFRDPAVIMRGMSVGMALLATGQLDLSRLVTHRFALEDVNEAFAAAVSKPEGFVKAVVEIEPAAVGAEEEHG
ncbi:zinc-binding dehydrogenase [uncultured Friedmanniella sp.]|uniref:zinc-binding dehydrogenase n=1 Tax=uncultured Friedmanniella sp. TaxID=335381 RepID=UPI0035CC6826